MNYLSHAYLKSFASDAILKDYYFYVDQSNKGDVKINDSLSRNTNCEIQEETIGGQEFLAKGIRKYNVFMTMYSQFIIRLQQILGDNLSNKIKEPHRKYFHKQLGISLMLQTVLTQ